MKNVAKHVIAALLYWIFTCTFTPVANCDMTSDELLLMVPRFTPGYIRFTTEGSSFSPVITLSENCSILWVWSDGTTSNSPTPTKDYGTPEKRVNRLRVTPWSALQRINIGYDGSDGGSLEIEHVPDQQVSLVRGLHLVAPYLGQWCSSYNQISSLDFSNFTNLDTIECFYTQPLTNVNLRNTPNLRRACFENCNLVSLDVSGSPNLEDLRGALNNYETINFGNIGADVWHICVRDNPQITNRSIFSDLTQLPNISELFIWNDNQTGSMRIPASHPTQSVKIRANGNQYTSLDLSGALVNTNKHGFVSFRNNLLSSINIVGCRQIYELYLENNQLDAATLDTLLATIDAFGTGEDDTGSWGQLCVDLRGNATPGDTGYGHALNLASRGWTVLAEGWTVEPYNNGEQRIDFSTTGDQTSMRCDFRSGTTAITTAIWYWSDGTTTQAVSGGNAAKAGLGDGDHAHYLIISNGAALTRFGSYNAGNGHLTAMSGFENCPSLRILYAYMETDLILIGRTNATRILEYHLKHTGLSDLALDQIFADAVASNVMSGTFWASSDGTAASDFDRATLISRGWNLYLP